MSNMKLPEYFCAHKNKLTETDLRADFLKQVADKFDIAHITYFCFPKEIDGSPTSRLITTYSEDWQHHYFASGYAEIDPVLRHGVKGFLPIDWLTIDKKDKCERNFFGEAKEFGIHDLGLTIPVRGLKGEIALFSVNSDLSQSDWEFYKHCYVSDIMHFASLFHDKVCDDILVDDETEITLSSREKQVLFWAGRGKTCWETAKILGLTERTVDFYLRNASQKLGAATKTQAVANAIAGKHIVHTLDT